MTMQNLFSQVLARMTTSGAGPGHEAAEAASLAPVRPAYAVGDVHGRDDLIGPLLDKIDEDITRLGIDTVDLVFLGDYIDRGPHSAGVLARLLGMCEETPGSVICLLGNHEQMMLDFLDDPSGHGARWLKNGGIETLASFGIDGVQARGSDHEMTEASRALKQAMPDGMARWLRNLPLWWQSGNAVCVHAGMDPAFPPQDQSDRAMIWGHPDFGTIPREDDLWVIHGHTVVKEPLLEPGRICVDTGAWKTGRLTAAALSTGACRFL